MERKMLILIFPIVCVVCDKSVLLTEPFFVFQTLQQDIESRGKSLSGLLRVCQHLGENPSTGAAGDCTVISPHRGARALKLAQRLEKRWQILYLKNLEWILHLEKNVAVSNRTNIYF